MASKNIIREPLKGNIAVIDGSLLAFRASAAGEKRSIEVLHRKSGNKRAFDGRRDFKTWLEELNQKRVNEAKPKFAMTDFEITDIIDAPPVGVSIKTLQSMLQSILSVCQASEYTIYLDEGETFRDRLATMMEYKGNRRDLIKPQNLAAVKEYLVLHERAKVVNELEADDYVNFGQFEGWHRTKSGEQHTIIAVTFDKDAMSNPGWVYDYRKNDDGQPIMEKPTFIDSLGELHWLTKQKEVKGWGRKYFYFQLLYGDDSDNYKANKLAGTRFGKKSAYDVLAELTTDKDCLQAVVNHYKEWYGKEEKFKYTSWDGKPMEKTWLELLTEIWYLAYMRRHPTDVPNVEQILKRVGVEL